MKILIVEDDCDIAETLKSELNIWGYEVHLINDFSKVIEEFIEINPQLVLMDIVLPYFNGFYYCQKMREFSKIPIIFISSRSEEVDIVQGMQFGGDDYIVKPLNTQVVRAKIQAILRRTYEFNENFDFMEYDSVKLFSSYAKILYNEKEISLTKTELLIMEILFKNKGAVSKREELMDRCWQSENFIDDNTLAVNIVRIRKKLSGIGLDLIRTKKGIGYYLEKNENKN